MMSSDAGRKNGSSGELLAAYRVYPDGREERIRGERLSNFTLEAFRDVLAASSTETVLHSFAGGGGMMAAFAMRGGGGSMAPSSYVVPSLLFEDVALSKKQGAQTAAPLSDPPPGS